MALIPPATRCKPECRQVCALWVGARAGCLLLSMHACVLARIGWLCVFWGVCVCVVCWCVCDCVCVCARFGDTWHNLQRKHAISLPPCCRPAHSPSLPPPASAPPSLPLSHSVSRYLPLFAPSCDRQVVSELIRQQARLQQQLIAADEDTARQDNAHDNAKNKPKPQWVSE